MLASFYSVRGFDIPTPPGWKIISRLLVVAIIRICRPLLPCPEDVSCYGDRRTVDVFRINYTTWNFRRNVFLYVMVRRMSIMSLRNKAQDSENCCFYPDALLNTSLDIALTNDDWERCLCHTSARSFEVYWVVQSSWNVMAHGDSGRGSEGETGEWSG